MITKEQAIKIFHEIQNGAGVDRQNFPDILKGSIPRKWWDDVEFSLGVEYGFLIALQDLFGITLDDLPDENGNIHGRKSQSPFFSLGNKMDDDDMSIGIVHNSP